MIDKDAAIVVVGCGKVGKSLAYFLKEKGYNISGVTGRRMDPVQETASLLGGVMAGIDIPAMTRDADIVFLAVPDGEIQGVCDEIAGCKGFKKGSVVLHLSGALSSEILLSAVSCGSYAGSMHPLQSFAGFDDTVNPFEGVVVSGEGDDYAVQTAKQLALDLGARFIPIRTDAKTLYHAAAVVASNYLVTVMDFACSLMKEAGMEDREAWDVLAPLISGTISNVSGKGTTRALTGPVSRGDIQTVSRHISEIGEKKNSFLDLYKVLGDHTVDIARRSGTLDHEKAGLMKREFARGGENKL